jgi:RimJ/RimL family protein N-acetyltransferase
MTAPQGRGDVRTLRAPASAQAPRGEPSRLVGRSVRVRPVEARDYDFLFRLYTDGDHLVRYRLRGSTPSPDAFLRFLWDQVVAQFIVESRDGHPIGLVSAFEPDFRNRYIRIAACSVDSLQSSGLVLEGVALLVSYLFENFDLRKIYAESLETNYEQFAMGEGRLFEIEGRMREHEYLDGRYQDVVLLAIYRDAWREHHERIFGSKGHF